MGFTTGHACNKLLVAEGVYAIGVRICRFLANVAIGEDVIIYCERNSIIKYVVFTAKKPVWVLFDVAAYAAIYLINFFGYLLNI